MLVVLSILIYLLLGLCFSLYLFKILMETPYFEPVFIVLAGIFWPLFGLTLLELAIYYKRKK